MGLGTVERVRNDVPLADAIRSAFERLRSEDAQACSLLFDVQWHPTMDVVDVIARELEDADEIRSLVLIHPSAAMTFIATTVGMRIRRVVVTAQRSVHDEVEGEDTDPTASKTMFIMAPEEKLEAFVRRAVGEARVRAVKRFALLFNAKSEPSIALAEVLAEELLASRVKEIGLIHPVTPLDTLAAALRLRLPSIRVALATSRK